MAWGIANNGAAYYPYFTCFFLCVTALCLILRDRRWHAGTSCVVTIAEIVAWMIPDFFPMVLGILNGQGSTLTNGVYRSPVGADIYSLRIQQPATARQRLRSAEARQLDGPLLPRSGHR